MTAELPTSEARLDSAKLRNGRERLLHLDHIRRFEQVSSAGQYDFYEQYLLLI